MFDRGMFDREPPVTISEPDIAFPREEVGSSSVSHVGYDPDAQTLYLTFRSTGMTYMYLGVPQEVYAALMAAGSMGRFVNQVVKPGYYCIPEGR